MAFAEQTSAINYEFQNTSGPSINPNQSVTFTIPTNFSGEMGYYCVICFHSNMENAL